MAVFVMDQHHRHLGAPQCFERIHRIDQDIGTDPDVVERDDGSLLISGSLSADALAERLDLTLPEDRDFATAAGFVLAVMRKLPNVGDSFEEQGWRFEIVDMDGRKIDKLLVSEVA
jgi:putative hemolysin